MSDNEPYIPKNPVSQGILSLFNDGDIGKSCTDITFDINNGEEKFYAHPMHPTGLRAYTC